MFIIAHVFFTMIFVEYIAFITKSKLPLIRFWLVIGSILPDIFDKPLSIFFPEVFSGRGYFHSPFVLILLFIFLFLIKLDRKIIFSLILGVSFHLMLDLPGIPFLFPIVSIQPSNNADVIQDWISSLLGSTIYLFIEIVATFLIGIYFWYLIYKNKSSIYIILFLPINTKKQRKKRRR